MRMPSGELARNYKINKYIPQFHSEEHADFVVSK